jgi:hypothetical protein
MSKPAIGQTRRDVLRWGATSATLAAALPSLPGWAKSASAAEGDPEIVMDGHVHITNRIYWEGIDPWTPTKQGWDFARARVAGVNCIIDNLICWRRCAGSPRRRTSARSREKTGCACSGKPKLPEGAQRPDDDCRKRKPRPKGN